MGREDAVTKQILIVDDDLNNRELLYFTLMKGAYDIHQAGTGDEATRLSQETPMEMALIDIELPDANGLDLAEQFRQGFPKMIILILSALDNPDLLQRACRVGVNAYVVKPFSIRPLLDLIQKLEAKAELPEREMQVLHNRTYTTHHECPD